MSANVKNAEFTLAEPRQARLKPSAASPNLGKSTETIFQTITFQKLSGHLTRETAALKRAAVTLLAAIPQEAIPQEVTLPEEVIPQVVVATATTMTAEARTDGASLE